RSITSTPPGATSSVTASPWRSTATGSASFTSRPAIAPRVALDSRNSAAPFATSTSTVSAPTARRRRAGSSAPTARSKIASSRSCACGVSPPRPPPSPSSRFSWRTTIAASPRQRGSPTMRIAPCSRVRTSPRSFTCQELRRITAQLTVNYKRGLYVLEDSVENRRLRRTTALVSDAADGTVTIRGNGRVLAYRLHPRDHAPLVPGVVVEHKHLDGVFAWIAAQQHDRDAARLANPKVTLRAKKRLRAAASSSASSVDP